MGHGGFCTVGQVPAGRTDNRARGILLRNDQATESRGVIQTPGAFHHNWPSLRDVIADELIEPAGVAKTPWGRSTRPRAQRCDESHSRSHRQERR